jgi:hypothetical protein
VNNYTISLTHDEIAMAASVGVARRVDSLRLGLADEAAKYRTDLWDLDISGALAELAFCKFAGCYWPTTLRNYKGADALNVDVKLSRQEEPHLIGRHNPPRDGTLAASRIYVLVLPGPNHSVDWIMAGWSNAMTLYLESNRKQFGVRSVCYAIPRENLFSMDTFPFAACAK